MGQKAAAAVGAADAAWAQLLRSQLCKATASRSPLVQRQRRRRLGARAIDRLLPLGARRCRQWGAPGVRKARERGRQRQRARRALLLHVGAERAAPRAAAAAHAGRPQGPVTRPSPGRTPGGAWETGGAPGGCSGDPRHRYRPHGAARARSSAGRQTEGGPTQQLSWSGAALGLMGGETLSGLSEGCVKRFSISGRAEVIGSCCQLILGKGAARKEAPTLRAAHRAHRVQPPFGLRAFAGFRHPQRRLRPQPRRCAWPLKSHWCWCCGTPRRHPSQSNRSRSGPRRSTHSRQNTRPIEPSPSGDLAHAASATPAPSRRGRRLLGLGARVQRRD